MMLSKLLFFLIVINVYLLNATSLNLTKEEQFFIKNKKEIFVHVEKDWEPFNFTNNNIEDGFVNDYLKLIVEQTGLTLKFVHGHTWSQYLEMIKDKKIDMISNMVVTPERAQYLLFSDNSVVTSFSALVLKRNSKITSLESLKGKSVAVVKGYYFEEQLKKYYPNINIIVAEKSIDTIKLVSLGKADAALGAYAVVKHLVNKNFLYDVEVNPIENKNYVFSKEYYFGFRNDMPLLKSIMDKAMQNVSPETVHALRNYWFEHIHQDDIKKDFLEPLHKAYLKNKPVIKMCNNPNWAPIEFANNNNLNDMQGMAIDTLKLIEKKLNIRFENVPTTSWKQSQEFLEAKKCDILPSAVKTAKRSEYANFTRPYLNLPLAIFTQKNKKIVSGLDEVINKTWTRQKGSGLINQLKQKYPKLKVIEVKGDKEALQWVNSGRAYFTIATLPVASHNISKYSLNDLHIAGYTKMLYDLSIAVRDDDVFLLNILNQTLDSISEDESKEIFKKWVSPIVKEAVPDYSILWKVVFVIIVFLVILLYRQQELSKLNNELQKKVDTKTANLKELNTHLEGRIEKTVFELRTKDKMLTQQAKMASMGEMLANIAHQWRQPLSVITTAATGIKVQKDLNVLTDKMEDNSLDKIVEASAQLSQTIDDFRNFFKVNKRTHEVNVKDVYKKTSELLLAGFKNKDIVFMNKIENIHISILENELIHVLMNVLNNSKDALLINKIQKKFIFVSIYQEDGFAVIDIKDNANGMKDDVITHVFEPNFTTKEDNDGTGIGLYMSKEIIESHMNGSITVQNVNFRYQDQAYKGANFIIKLPL